MIVHLYMNAKTNCGLRFMRELIEQDSLTDLLGKVLPMRFLITNKPGTIIHATKQIDETTCKRCKKERKADRK